MGCFTPLIVCSWRFGALSTSAAFVVVGHCWSLITEPLWSNSHLPGISAVFGAPGPLQLLPVASLTAAHLAGGPGAGGPAAPTSASGDKKKPPRGGTQVGFRASAAPTLLLPGQTCVCVCVCEFVGPNSPSASPVVSLFACVAVCGSLFGGGDSLTRTRMHVYSTDTLLTKHTHAHARSPPATRCLSRC